MSVPSAGLHKPVMLAEVMHALQPKAGEVYIDATFGAGGYSRAMLESAECRVYAIDRDPQVVMLADALARDFPGRFLLLAGCFGDMLSLMLAEGIESVDGIVMDFGVSSMQIDQAERGFSFRHDGPLDMRMGHCSLDAATLVNHLPEAELANIIYEYGEEKASRKIAAAIVAARQNMQIETTQQLADIVRGVVRKTDKIDPATRTFQALRIKVNDELGEIERALEAAPQLLRPGGRLIAVTFHSLEDRIVKRFLRPKPKSISRHDPHFMLQQEEATNAHFVLPQTKPVLPSEEEMQYNPRARSAKLRIAIRNEVPVQHGEKMV